VYPVYVAEWHITPIAVTSIFAVYPITLVVVLIIFGGISDFVGRRAVLLAGLAAMALGILLFAVAPSVGWLYAGRVLQGIGVGLAMAPASAAMVEFNPSGVQSRASSINTAATAVGLALATVVGGALVQYAPFPAHLAFWVLLVLAAVSAVFVLLMPRSTAATTTTERWRPRGITVPRGMAAVFVTAALAMAAVFAMGAMFLSLGSSIAETLIGTDNALVAGSVIAISAVLIGVSAVLGRRFAPRTAVAIGGVCIAIGMGLFALSATEASLAAFIACSVFAGTGYGLLFLGGLGLINGHAPVHHRAQTLSAAYLVAYLTQGVVAVSIGLSATVTGLALAVDLWSPIIAALCLAASVVGLLALRRTRVTAPA
jgi:predicted MFS family arabinose efflux permease